jgi:hypothetical protein
MKNIILSLAAISIAACSTTQREEVRADVKNVDKQQRELEAAKQNGTMNEVREESKDLRQAQQELREDQRQLYRPGADGSSVEGLRLGQQESGELGAVPAEYRGQYSDGDGSYYRSDGLRIYKFSAASRTVIGVYPMGR